MFRCCLMAFVWVCGLSLAAEESRLVDDLKLPSGRVITRQMVVGYRGECVEEPENTARALTFSISRGFPVAVDLLTTADGETIAAAEAGFAARKWKGDLEEFDAGTRALELWPNNFRNRGYAIARLAEVVASCGGKLPIVRVADGSQKTREAAQAGGAAEILETIETIDDPVQAVQAFENGAARIFTTGPAKLFTQIEGLLARERVIKTDFRAKLVAHAGGRECAPENTLPAFQNMQKGGFSVEADFHVTSDGVVWLTHESWMNHPKNCVRDKMAIDLKWQGELENGDAGWWIGEKWKGTKFCTMDELFATMTPDRTLILHVINDKALEKIKEGLSRYPALSPKNALFICDPRAVHKYLPDYLAGGCPLPRKGWMQHDAANPVMSWAREWNKPANCGFTAPRWDNELISRAYVDELHRKGVVVNVWSIDDPYIALAALDRGVDLITSDRPENMYLEMLGQQAPKPIKYNGIALDGVLDEDRWRDAKWYDDFGRLANRRDRGAFSRKTAFAVWADATTLYVAARCPVDDVEEMKKRPETDLWLADNFEVFLSPSGKESAYYHFAVSPNSKAPMAEYFEEAGNIQPDPYRPRWESKTAWETNAWTCEMKIPLTAFYWTRQKDWKTTWRVNFCRTLQKPLEYATWSPLETGFHEPGNFRMMEGMPWRPNGWDCLIRKATATILEKCADGTLKGELDVDCHIPFDRTCRVVTDNGSSAYAAYKAGDHHVRFPCTFGKGGRCWTKMKIEYEGGNIGTERSYPVWVAYRPIDIRLTTPAYRGNFYPGQDSDIVAGFVTVLGGASAVVSIEGPGFARQERAVDKTGAFRFDTRGFQVGDAVLTVTTGKDVQTMKLRKLAKRARRMSWVENGNLVVDGKPTFRRNIYSGTYMMGEKFLAFYHADAPNLHATPACDTMIPIGPDRLFPGLEREEAIYDNPPSAKVYAKLDEILAKYRDVDFCAYYICDEPECRGISPIYLKYIYDYVVDKDPYHVVLSATRGGKAYVDCIDWADTHPYIDARNSPQGRKYAIAPSEVGRFVDDFDVAGRPDKVVGVLPTCFAYRWQSLESDYPTFDEYVLHTWAAVARGAKSVWPYASHDLGDRPQLYLGTCYLFSSFEALEDVLLFGKRTTVTRDRQCEVAVWEHLDDRLVVALNYTAARMCVTLPGDGTYHEFRGDRTWKGGESVTLAPLETLVATLRPQDTDLPSRAEVEAQVAHDERERLGRDNQLLEKYAQVKVDGNLDRNFGGGHYKLFDGTCQMIARKASGRLENWMTIAFKDDLKPTFARVIVHGSGIIDKLEVSVPAGDGWRKVGVKNRKVDTYCVEVELEERLAPTRIRLDFPGTKGQRNALEIYEIEIPKV